MSENEIEQMAAAVETARDEPGEAPLDPFETGLRAENVRVRDRAATGMYEVSKEHADRLVDSIPLIVPLLDEERATLRTKGIKILDHVGIVDATVLVPHTAALAQLLRDDSALVASAVPAPLLRIADTEPSALVPWIDDIVELLDADLDSTRVVGVAILERIVTAKPEAAMTAIPALLTVLEEDTDHGNEVQMDPTIARGRASPDDQFRGMNTLVGGDDRPLHGGTLRQGAVATLIRLTETDLTGAMAEFETHLPRLCALLDDPSPAVRGGTAAILAEIADEQPRWVKPAQQRLIELLDDPTFVGLNAVRALESLGTDTAQAALEAAVDDTSIDPEVRQFAERSLAEFDR